MGGEESEAAQQQWSGSRGAREQDGRSERTAHRREVGATRAFFIFDHSRTKRKSSDEPASTRRFLGNTTGEEQHWQRMAPAAHTAADALPLSGAMGDVRPRL